ncbi:MAG: hypothetical protein KKA81_17490, partial [Bacteroidetes bacterium]|nr:hypothetical protein [Bacteroidota bacterium]
GGTTREMKVVVKSSGRKPVVKILKPDYGKICGSIMNEDSFSFLRREAAPDVHSLASDTSGLLRSHRIPLVWKKAGEPFYYGRFVTKCKAETKNWEVVVVDSRGRKTIKYKGTGKVPVQIDLKEEDITKFHAREPYSPVLILTVKSGKKYRFNGDVFYFDVLIKKGKDETLVELNSGELFDNNNLLTEKGEEIISALGHVLTETPEPTLEIRTRTSDKSLSTIRTLNFVEALRKEFLVPAKNIKAALYIYSKIDFPSIELIVKESKAEN